MKLYFATAGTIAALLLAAGPAMAGAIGGATRSNSISVMTGAGRSSPAMVLAASPATIRPPPLAAVVRSSPFRRPSVRVPF